MARRHMAYWACGLLLLLATCALAYDKESGDSDYAKDSGYAKDSVSSGDSYSPGDSYGSGEKEETPAPKEDDDTCDPTKKTETANIAIIWKKRPDEVDDFFEKLGIGLKMIYEWDAASTVYEAADQKEAQDIMEDILAILSGAELTGYGPFADKDAQRAIKVHVKAVYGDCFMNLGAATPADLPQECNLALPNSCPDPLWGLNRIKAPEVWDQLGGIVNTPPTSSVMVIDSGVNAAHQDLAANLVPGLTVTGYTNPPRAVSAGNAIPPLTDTNGHGTHVAGTIFARWGNGAGTPVGVVGSALGGSCGCAQRNPAPGQEGIEGFCSLNCIAFAAARGVRVINISWGRFRNTRAGPDDPQRSAITRFCNTGGIAAILAHNQGQNIIQANRFQYPAALAADLAATNPKCIITVANLQRDGSLAASSNFGAAVKVAAPGTNIFSTWIGSTTATNTISGTSMATPHVAGMATLLFNEFTDAAATQAQVHDCIVNRATSRARPAFPGQTIGGGVVDLEASFRCMMGDPVCPTEGLPPCVNGTSARAVRPARCNNSTNLCRPIAGNTRAVCRYDYFPNGRLCRVDASTADFEELSLEEMQTLGLSGEPAQYLEGEEDAEASLLGASEAQQIRRRRQKLTCGQCINRQCVTQTAKWCKRPPTAAQG